MREKNKRRFCWKYVKAGVKLTKFDQDRGKGLGLVE